MEKIGVFYGGGRTVLRLPPGFRFHPTDEELVMQYLRRKVMSFPLPASIIPDIELSRFDPWDLPGGGGVTTGCSGKERYLFNFRLAKYQKGSRTNRSSGSGYWKVTGRDRPIMASRGDQVVGIKKFLVFYRGKLPNGTRTDWVMHEYHLTCINPAQTPSQPEKKNSVTYIGDWMLCHVFQKKRPGRDEDSDMVMEGGNFQAMAGGNPGRIQFTDFMGQRDSSPPSPTSESSCVTDVSVETCSEEEGCSTNTSPLIPFC